MDETYSRALAREAGRQAAEALGVAERGPAREAFLQEFERSMRGAAESIRRSRELRRRRREAASDGQRDERRRERSKRKNKSRRRRGKGT